MSLSHSQGNSDFYPIDADEDGGLSSLDLKSYRQHKPSFKRATPKQTNASTNWQRTLLATALVLILWAAFYYIQTVLTQPYRDN